VLLKCQVAGEPVSIPDASPSQLQFRRVKAQGKSRPSPPPAPASPTYNLLTFFPPVLVYRPPPFPTFSSALSAFPLSPPHSVRAETWAGELQSWRCQLGKALFNKQIAHMAKIHSLAEVRTRCPRGAVGTILPPSPLHLHWFGFHRTPPRHGKGSLHPCLCRGLGRPFFG
jgi:hypothetical protein